MPTRPTKKADPALSQHSDRKAAQMAYRKFKREYGPRFPALGSRNAQILCENGYITVSNYKQMSDLLPSMLTELACGLGGEPVRPSEIAGDNLNTRYGRELPVPLMVVFYLRYGQRVPAKVKAHKETREFERKYQRMVAELGEAKTLEGLALGEVIFDLLMDFTDEAPTGLAYKWAAQLRPWMQGRESQFYALAHGAYGLDVNFILPRNYWSPHTYDTKGLLQEAQGFWRQVQDLNFPEGRWVRKQDIVRASANSLRHSLNMEALADDCLLYLAKGTSEANGLYLASASEVEGPIKELDGEIKTLSARIRKQQRQLARLKSERAAAISQAKADPATFKLPTGTKRLSGING